MKKEKLNAFDDWVLDVLYHYHYDVRLSEREILLRDLDYIYFSPFLLPIILFWLLFRLRRWDNEKRRLFERKLFE